MNFEAYKISDNNYQLFELGKCKRNWLASFNKLNTLLNYYIYCHNLSGDTISFTGVQMTDNEMLLLNSMKNEWLINIME